jgi:hypothetical protein
MADLIAGAGGVFASDTVDMQKAKRKKKRNNKQRLSQTDVPRRVLER